MQENVDNEDIWMNTNGEKTEEKQRFMRNEQRNENGYEDIDAK